ncbi:MAG: Rpp14/Pop5 family protein [Promethearchaeota archaeon]
MEIKERQRYLLFKIIADKRIEQQRLINAIWRQLFQLYGEFGTSQTGLWLVEYQDNYGILRTNISSLLMVRTTLAVIHKINEKNCILFVQGISGTIESLKRNHFLY